MDDVRVKTLDKKNPGPGSSFLLVFIFAALALLSIALWGALVMFTTEYLEMMGVVDSSLDYGNSVGLGLMLLAGFSVLGSLWRGSAR